VGGGARLQPQAGAVPGIIGAFQDELRYRSRSKAEQPIPCVVSSALTLLGLPEPFFA
jgi:hypothetical protein